jgi:hypothetical protein
MSKENVSSPKDGTVQSLKAERVQTELVLRMASRERHPVRVQIAGKSILVTLHDHPGQGGRGGITDQLLDFAARLG